MSKLIQLLTHIRIRRAVVWGLTLFLVGLALFVFIGTGDFRREAVVESRLQETRAKVKTLARENALFRLKISDLRIGSKEVERAAREEHGLVKPDEVIYEFPGSHR
jgi:cell division protein FtsB